MIINSLGYLGVESPRAAEWLEFAPTVLGLSIMETGPDGTVYVRADDRHHRIAVRPAERDGLRYVGWEMQNAAALKAAVEHLAGQGVVTTPGTEAECAERRVRGLVWFRDLIGVRHELFCGQLNLPKTFRPGRALSGFVTGDQGLGHVVFMVPDVEAAKDYYTRVMGFSLTDEIQAHVKLAFFHTNRRHHSLAIGERPGSRLGLLHLMLQVKDLDDVGLAYDLCQARDVPIKRTLGRHTNDRTVSFYLGTPAGFDIEYGWGGIEVEPGENVATLMNAAAIWGHKFLSDLSVLEPVAGGAPPVADAVGVAAKV